MKQITLNVFLVFVLSGSAWSALLENYGGAIVGLLFVVIYELGEIHRAIEKKP